MQWNFFIQRELMNDMSLDIGYVGSGSRKQIGYSPFNNALTPGPGCDRAAPSAAGVRRPRRRLEPVQRLLQQSAGLVAQALLGADCSSTLNYTWQKALDGQSSLAEVKVQNPFDRRQDYSRSSWDINHVFNFSYVYELPFGRGRKLGRQLGQGGRPVAGRLGAAGHHAARERGRRSLITTGSGSWPTRAVRRQRPNLVGDPNDGPKTPDEWFNTKAFVLPAQYTFGTAGPYITNADGIIGIDMALEKKFRIRERHASGVQHRVLQRAEHGQLRGSDRRDEQRQLRQDHHPADDATADPVQSALPVLRGYYDRPATAGTLAASGVNHKGRQLSPLLREPFHPEDSGHRMRSRPLRHGLEYPFLRV